MDWACLLSKAETPKLRHACVALSFGNTLEPLGFRQYTGRPSPRCWTGLKPRLDSQHVKGGQHVGQYHVHHAGRPTPYASIFWPSLGPGAACQSCEAACTGAHGKLEDICGRGPTGPSRSGPRTDPLRTSCRCALDCSRQTHLASAKLQRAASVIGAQHQPRPDACI